MNSIGIEDAFQDTSLPLIIYHVNSKLRFHGGPGINHVYNVHWFLRYTNDILYHTSHQHKVYCKIIEGMGMKKK